MSDEKRLPLNVVLRRSLKKFRAMPLSARIEELIEIGVIKPDRADEVRKRVAAMEAAAAAAAATNGHPPAS